MGGVRTALYNWLFARHHGGEFILRIEDTDRTRSTQEAVEQILASLRWLGLDWDGEPAFQSDRLPLYQASVDKLVADGLAYEDEDERGVAVRLRVPHGEPVQVRDLVHGTVSFETESVEDFVIRKADGFPTYNFACAVDDHDMGITHVIRGDDHLSNTPKQILLYQALGCDVPEFAHVPMILGEDGQRLSKRHGATGVDEFRELGILPEALLNFVALLGWSPGDDREVMTRAEMVEAFDLSRVRATASRFGRDKLDWLNWQHLRALDDDALGAVIGAWLDERLGIAAPEAACARLAGMVRERLRTLADLDAPAQYLFTDHVTWDEAAGEKAFKNVDGPVVLRAVIDDLAALPEWTAEALEPALRGVAERLGVGFKKVAQPVRYAVTGTMVSPPLFDTLVLVGRDRALSRLTHIWGRGSGLEN